MGDMKQRLFGWNYTQPRMYMITLATEGRKPLFGEISGTPTQPRVELTELGKKVNHAIEYIPHYYPQLTILAQQMMPDHLHFIIYVRKPLPVHLGKVIAGFKAGCNRDYRFLLQNSKTPERQTDNNEEPPIGSVSGSSAAANIGSVSGSSADSNIGSVSGSSAAAEKSILFEPGYHDRVLSHRGQLQAMIDYIHDNPRRLLIKREHSVLFAHRTVTAAGTTFQAIGNDALLQAPRRLFVRCSRRLTDDDITRECQRVLSLARAGAVLVSPFISKGERTIEQEALKEGLPIIKLLDHALAPYEKPWGHYFDACAAGRLLLLSPWEYQTQKVTLTRDMCNLLNTLAAKLC